MKNIKLNIIIVLLSIFILSTSLQAHGPLAHWSFAPSEVTKSFQILPDYMSSRTFVGFEFHLNSFIVTGMEASTFFGWSHGCQRNGVLSTDSIPIPIRPYNQAIWGTGIYPQSPTSYGTPSGVELPGEDMYYIYSNKLLTENKNLLMKLTAQGFKCHNVEDSIVHFSYFKGGSVYNWFVEHNDKEEWAECITFLTSGGSWDVDGLPVVPSGYDGLGLSGDSGIINLAQKAFRKNRQTVDASPAHSGNYETITVQTASEIDSIIEVHNEDLQNYFVSEWLGIWRIRFNQARCLEFLELQLELGWDPVTLVLLQQASYIEATSAIAEMP